MEASITLKSIAKKIDKEVVLADLSIGVENNSNHAIIGQNGSGKSSIIKILVGIIEKDAGIAYIHGKDISKRSDETRMMTGYMPQYTDFDDEISIYENLFIYSQLFNVSEDVNAVPSGRDVIDASRPVILRMADDAEALLGV